MNTGEDETTEDFKKENHLFIIVPVLLYLYRFLLLNPLLNAGGRHEICGILKASILSSVVLRKHGILGVSSIRNLDFIDDLHDVW